MDNYEEPRKSGTVLKVILIIITVIAVVAAVAMGLLYYNATSTLKLIREKNTSLTERLNDYKTQVEEFDTKKEEYEKQIEQEMLERQRREMEALEAARKAQEEADKANNAGNTGNNSSSGSAMVDQNALNNVLKNHTAEDVAMLAAIIECEAGNQSYEGKCAVGSVVINRVADPRFANSISGVIYAPYQFSPVASGRFAIVLARGANAACTQAAVDVLNGYININALYFHVYDSSVDVGGTVIGDHVFY